MPTVTLELGSPVDLKKPSLRCRGASLTCVVEPKVSTRAEVPYL